MAASCIVCHGQGRLLSELCPLCEGDPTFIDDGDLPKQALPIFILAGQSNCVGRGDPNELPGDLVTRVFESVRICFCLEPHRPDETHVSGWTALTPSCQVNPLFGAHFGPEFSAADHLRASRSCSEVLIAKYAMGSSSLVMPSRDDGDPEWDPAGHQVKDMLRFLKDQREAVGRPAYFAGLFWNQGNSDLKVKDSDSSANKYTEQLIALVTLLRRELRDHHRGLPLVACHVRKGSKAKTTQQVNDAISRACEQLDLARCVLIPEGATLLPGDQFHFDGQTLLALGHALGDAMGQLL